MIRKPVSSSRWKPYLTTWLMAANIACARGSGAADTLATALGPGQDPDDDVSNGDGDGDAGDGDGDGDGDGGDGDGGDGDGGDGDGGDGDGGDSDGGDGDAGDGDAGDGDGDTDPEYCNVDFLFVVDNSTSMKDQQEALIGAFPEFIETIEDTVDAKTDYQLMAVDTDAWGRCDTANPWSGQSPNHSTCNDYIEATEFEECDRTLGAGVVHPAGAHASNMECSIEGGNRYLVDDEPDLEAAFDCVARVGTAGNAAERPIDALLAALSPELNGLGGCNDGFLRDDAILVVAFMSDDPNYEDADDPEQWHDDVLQAKSDQSQAVVVLGLTPFWPGCMEGKGPPRGEHWAEFLDLFGDQALHGDVCGTADDYSDFFQSAVDKIDQACEDPPQ